MGGERLTLVLNRVILSELIDLACPTAEHLKFLTLKIKILEDSRASCEVEAQLVITQGERICHD